MTSQQIHNIHQTQYIQQITNIIDSVKQEYLSSFVEHLTKNTSMTPNQLTSLVYQFKHPKKETVKTCAHIFTKGVNIHKKCETTVKTSSAYCSKHAKNKKDDVKITNDIFETDILLIDQEDDDQVFDEDIDISDEDDDVQF